MRDSIDEEIIFEFGHCLVFVALSAEIVGAIKVKNFAYQPSRRRY
jgi:hypothetical protein